MSQQSFADLGVSKSVCSALAARGINEPFAVQRLVIEDVMSGSDVLVQSPTGSGKTLAFGIPMVERIGSPSGRTAALVLAPTRELAGQIVDELDSSAKARGLRIAAVYGGVGFGPQIKAARSADILVATPGRLEDLIERGVVKLSRIDMLVLDEADRMLDMGFKPAVDRIVALTPSDRQTLFFSATLEGATGKAARAFTRNPIRRENAPKPERSSKVDHRFVAVDSQSAKLPALVRELRHAERGRTLVFVRTKRGADRLVKRLRASQVEAVAMHGDKSQNQRQRALTRFERGDVDLLVATDVAARGIDVADITHVINFDAPDSRDTYVHRVGRTGRAGRDGVGISFVLGDQAAEMRKLARDLGLEGPAKGSGKGPGKSPENGRPKGPSRQDSARRRRRRKPQRVG